MTGLFDPGSDPSTLTTSRQAGKELLSHLRLVVRRKGYGCGSALDLLNQARLSGELSIREMLASSIMLAHASYQKFDEPAQFCVVGDHLQPRCPPRHHRRKSRGAAELRGRAPPTGIPRPVPSFVVPPPT